MSMPLGGCVGRHLLRVTRRGAATSGGTASATPACGTPHATALCSGRGNVAKRYGLHSVGLELAPFCRLRALRDLRSLLQALKPRHRTAETLTILLHGHALRLELRVALLDEQQFPHLFAEHAILRLRGPQTPIQGFWIHSAARKRGIRKPPAGSRDTRALRRHSGGAPTDGATAALLGAWRWRRTAAAAATANAVGGAVLAGQALWDRPKADTEPCRT
mmetsp:Transcript_25855/g.72098  ORF Transcript_25855/g.72098 Transcript_25855/m.72098 type:complete len:219 (+) Transcript_25855:359-1015(+)